jgi:hypothetical protein
MNMISFYFILNYVTKIQRQKYATDWQLFFNVEIVHTWHFLG